VPNSVKIDGVPRLLRTLEGLATRARQDAGRRVAVGYRADYAVFVHEDLTAYHAGGGQAKFLETPLRAMHQQLGAMIREDVSRGASLIQAERRAAEALLAASQALVPVDTGALLASAFIEVI
jgi:hypothetical protein